MAGDHIPIAAWRLLLLVEGFPSIMVTVFAWYQILTLPTQPGILGDKKERLLI